MIVSRRHATLLELLIALSLLALLLTSLMALYSQVIRIEGQLREERSERFRLLYAEHRLNEILPKTLSAEEKGAFFYTDEGALIFTYDNGLDGGRLFSNEVTSKLYLDPSGRLKLITWPSIERLSEEDPPFLGEVLLEGIEEISFSFFRPPRKTRKEKPVDPEEKTVTGEWFSSWPLGDSEIPALVKIRLGRRGEPPVVFSFLLSNSKETILYR